MCINLTEGDSRWEKSRINPGVVADGRLDTLLFYGGAYNSPQVSISKGQALKLKVYFIGKCFEMIKCQRGGLILAKMISEFVTN